MALERPSFMQNLDYPAQSLRHWIDGAFRQGVFGDTHLKVTPRAGGANMSVDVLRGTACIQGSDGQANQGAYLVTSTATENRVIAAAPGAGTSRYDLVYARVRDGQVLGNTTNDWMIGVVTGVASSSPVVPPLPPSSLSIGVVSITSSTTSIQAGQLFDWRPSALLTSFQSFASLSARALTATYSQWGPTVSVRSHGNPVAAMATLTGQNNPTGTSSSYAVWARIDISMDSGVTWQTGTEVISSADNQFAPATIAATSFRTGVPTAQVQARAMVHHAGQTGDARNGQLTLTVTAPGS